MEDFGSPAMLREQRIERCYAPGGRFKRAIEGRCSAVQRTWARPGAYTFHRADPSATIKQILDDKDELSLTQSRKFPAFRKPVADDIIRPSQKTRCS
jgi:hypothetical protein